MNKATVITKFQIAIKARYFAIAASSAASGDVRYYLDGVNVEPATDGKGALLVGTDGHRMIVMHDEEGICKQNLILRKTKDMIASCLKSAKLSEFPDAILVLTDDGQLMVGPGGIHEGSVSIDPIFQFPGNPVINGKYSDWRRVVPSADDIIPGMPGAYNGAYIAEFCKIARVVDGEYGGVTFFHHKDDGAHKTLLVRSTGNKDFLGILMPMRIDSIEGIPDWLKSVA
jgi:hypothetical protein